MARRSAADLAIARPPLPSRPDAPKELSQVEAMLWDAIVADKPAGWFDSASHPLLAAYCRAAVFSNTLAAEFAAMGDECLKVDLSRARILKEMQEKQEKLMAMLATKLRLTQQSRYTPQAADTAARDVAKPKLWEVG